MDDRFLESDPDRDDADPTNDREVALSFLDFSIKASHTVVSHGLDNLNNEALSEAYA